MARLIFTRHAERRRMQWAFAVEDVRAAVTIGEAIESYPADTPYPSRLVLAWVKRRPIHVVAADMSTEDIIIVTMYEPDPALWDATFRIRRSR
jgi:hypothetical protein